MGKRKLEVIYTCRRCKYFGKMKKIHFSICHNSKSPHFKKPFPHKKMPRACKFFNGKLEWYVGPYIDYDEIEGMKFVENLRNIHPNSDFWIIGTAPDLDLYPDDFFDDKLSITLNFACIGFPNSTYFCVAHTKIAKAIVDKLGSNYLSKSIFSATCRKPRNTEDLVWWEDWGLDPIYAKMLKGFVFEQNSRDADEMVKQLTNGGPFWLLGNKGPINFAIQIVALLGAKKIILAGCFNKPTGFYTHAQKRGISEFYREKPGDRLIWREGEVVGAQDKRRETLMLMRLFKKHNIEFVRHRFDKEKNDFIFEEIGK